MVSLSHLDDIFHEQDKLYPYQRCVAVALRKLFGVEEETGAHELLIQDFLRRFEKYNILVASPTGSGKTFAIEKAVHLARLKKTRLFVCEPLIALAAQIYQRLGGASSQDLCLKTGLRCQGSPEAPIQICTFEVLCRLLTNSPNFLVDACPLVVIDEFHCISSERGPVLCELLTMCNFARPPPALLALSGTLPNIGDIASLLTRVSSLPTLMTGARERPVPLFFEMWYPSLSNTLPLPSFVNKRFKPQTTSLSNLHSKTTLLSLMRTLVSSDRCPALIINFSCRCLDKWADWASSVDWGLTSSQKSTVKLGFDKLLGEIESYDKTLFRFLETWALKGVATHHSHRPPQYLELVSQLAEKRCLPFVFSTSTLSAGINLPVKTMVLASARIPTKKGDEMITEDLDAALFHQLSGRAGRPGLETKGFCLFVGPERTDAKFEVFQRTAQWLRDRGPAPVKVNSDKNEGLVLRALRFHRNLCVDQRLFDRHIREIVRQQDFAKTSRAFALSQIDEEDLAKAKQFAEDVCLLSKAQSHLRNAALIKNPSTSETFSFNFQELVVKRRLLSDPLCSNELVLSTARPLSTFPFEYHTQILEVRKAIHRLVEHEASDADRNLARVFVSTSETPKHRGELLWAYGDAAYTQICERLISEKFVEVDGTLTDLGRAACEVRTSLNCVEVITDLLSKSELQEDVFEMISAASRWTGDVFGEDVRSLAEAAQDWALGTCLVDISEQVPVGLFIRHIVRVSDVLREAEAVMLHLQPAAETTIFKRALDLIEHGLPFKHRALTFFDDAESLTEVA